MLGIRRTLVNPPTVVSANEYEAQKAAERGEIDPFPEDPNASKPAAHAVVDPHAPVFVEDEPDAAV
jgi:hypothetical protein